MLFINKHTNDGQKSKHYLRQPVVEGMLIMTTTMATIFDLI